MILKWSRIKGLQIKEEGGGSEKGVIFKKENHCKIYILGYKYDRCETE